MAQGSFVCKLARIPLGAAVPTGTVAMILLASNGIVYQSGVADFLPDLAALGSMYTIS